ncbi:MAG: Gldg family protein, partial [Verrucomicrobia bacterium]|nr:Gldg family protein [Verrucomicrobiota bacterium]
VGEQRTPCSVHAQRLPCTAGGGERPAIRPHVTVRAGALHRFLDPQRETLLEYDIARALSQVMNPKKGVVGVMTPLPMFGQAMNPMMMRMGQQGGQEPWVFVQELQKDFDVKQVPMDSEAIDSEIKVLVVVHPKDITDKAQYAVDQFVMRGGKLIAFLDAMSLVDKPANPQNQFMANMPGGPSSLDKLLKAWGITFENTKVIADMVYATQLSRGNKGAEKVPTFLTVNETGIEKNDVLTSQLKKVMIPFGGAFSGTPAAGLKQTVLLRTTQQSQFVDGFQAQFSSQDIISKFAPSGKEQTLALRLEGKFKTAFPDGKPGADDKKDEKSDDKKDAKPEEKKSGDTLKEGKTDGVVILVGDSDLLYDQFTVQVQNFFGQKMVTAFNDNLPFAQNMVEQLAGDANLIRVRSRAISARPFTVVQEMEAKAQEKHRKTLQDLEAGLQETQKKINELQQHKKDSGQRLVLSPEQQLEIAKCRKQEAQAKGDVKKARKELRKDVESLQSFLRGMNIAGMPLLVAAAGITLFVVRKNRSGAK